MGRRVQRSGWMGTPHKNVKAAEMRVQHNRTGVSLTLKTVEEYLEHLKRKERVQGTIDSYRRKIRRLYEDLPEDGKVILDRTLCLWREKLAEDGCSPAAINQFIMAVNGYLEYMGAREYQVVDKLDAVADAQRPGFSHPERETDRPNQRDGVYPPAVLGGSAAGGEGQPRCLRKLYQVTREGIKRDIALLVEQAQDRLMEEEQLVVGWDG